MITPRITGTRLKRKNDPLRNMYARKERGKLQADYNAFAKRSGLPVGMRAMNTKRK